MAKHPWKNTRYSPIVLSNQKNKTKQKQNKTKQKNKTIEFGEHTHNSTVMLSISHNITT